MFLLTRLLSFIVLCCCSTALMGQSRTITGTVTNSEGIPLRGATVLQKGHKNATQTSETGNFTLNVSGTSPVLVISSSGFISQYIPISTGTSLVKIKLSEDQKQLEEVIVTALGITKKSKSLVYAVETIKASELTEVRDPNNVINSLQGKLSNALISQGSGGPGSAASIILRGNRSLQGSSEALIVVDGVPFQNTTYNTVNDDGNSFGTHGTDGASAINPDDIESISVLKGASAAALYGSQAGNGVILITTKKGKKGTASVSVNSGIVRESPFVLPAVQNTYGQGNGGVINPMTGDSWGAKMTGQSYTNHLGKQSDYSPQPDNIRNYFRNGISLNNTISVSGGSDKMQTYLSYTNNAIQGIIPSNNLHRHTLNLRMSFDISERFSVDSKITYINQDLENMPRAGYSGSQTMMIYNVGRSMHTDALKQYEEINSLGIPEPTVYPSTKSSSYQNPYWWANRTSINEKRDRYVGFVKARFKITDWLSLSGRVNLDKSFDEDNEKRWDGSIATDLRGYYAEESRISTESWADLMLEGRNNISKDFAVDYQVGAIYQDRRYKSTIKDAGGLTMANYFEMSFAAAPQVFPSLTTIQTQAIFGQANFSYKNAIFLNASLRNDWDSRLPSPYAYNYPSVGASLVLSDLVRLPSAISFLKISGNFAQVGNGGKFSLLNTVYFLDMGAGNFIYRSLTYPLPNLKPEIVKNKEFSIDARFVNNRLGLSATYYKSNSINQLLQIGLPVGSGFSDKYINTGDIQNSGVELVFTAVPILKNNFRWDINANISFNKNKVVRLDEDVKKISLTGGSTVLTAIPEAEEGRSFGDLSALRWARDDKDRFLVDADGKPLRSADWEYIGNYNPKGSAGITNTFTYKNFSLRVLVNGRFGGMMVSGTEINLAYSGLAKATEDFREGGLNLGGVDENGNKVTKSITAQDFWQSVSSKQSGVGEFFAYDATNFRVRELSLGYTINLAPSSFIKSARVSFIARNLFWLYRGSTILDIPGIGTRKMSFDPDMSQGTDKFQGAEYGGLPSTRSLGFNLQLSL